MRDLACVCVRLLSLSPRQTLILSLSLLLTPFLSVCRSPRPPLLSHTLARSRSLLRACTHSLTPSSPPFPPNLFAPPPPPSPLAGGAHHLPRTRRAVFPAHEPYLLAPLSPLGWCCRRILFSAGLPCIRDLRDLFFFLF